MKHSTDSLSQRRGFLWKFASIAGAAAVFFSGKGVLAEDTACSTEVARLKKMLNDGQFRELREKARLLRRLSDKFGSGVVEETRKHTAENAENRMKKANIPQDQRNLEQVKRFFSGVGDAAEYTWVEDTPQRLQARVTRCRWADELKKDGNGGEVGYSLACAFDPGYCAGLNPAIKFTRTKTLMMGDDHCNHTYELKA